MVYLLTQRAKELPTQQKQKRTSSGVQKATHIQEKRKKNPLQKAPLFLLNSLSKKRRKKERDERRRVAPRGGKSSRDGKYVLSSSLSLAARTFSFLIYIRKKKTSAFDLYWRKRKLSVNDTHLLSLFSLHSSSSNNNNNKTFNTINTDK